VTRYWAIRTDSRNNTPWLWNELQDGRLRQGWSRRPDEDLEVVEEVRRIGGRLTDGQRETWRRSRRLLSSQGGVNVGDLVVTPHLPQFGTWTIVRVVGPYRFSIDDGRNWLGRPDFGHILPVEVVTRPVPWRDPAVPQSLQRAMRVRQPMWSLDPVAEAVEMVARDFAL
jgi:hypothetical protein